MPVREFMTIFDSDYAVKVEKKNTDTDELYYTDIKGQDLEGCAGFEHLNKIMTGYLIKKVLTTAEEKKE